MNSELFEHQGRDMLLAACTVLCIVFGVVWTVRASDEKLVKADDPVQRTDAVMITEISVGGMKVDAGLFLKPDLVQPVAPFPADREWLDKMTIVLINRTNKTIVRAGVTMQFLDTGDCVAQPCDATLLQLGNTPLGANDGREGQPTAPRRPKRADLDWKPGQRLALRVHDFIDQISASISNRMSLSAVNRVAIHLGAFYFADGMVWSVTGFSIPDPIRAGKFTRLPSDYFPGRVGQNWPPGYSQ